MKAGDRVRITGIMPEEPNPIPVGTEGTVVDVNPHTGLGRGQIFVDWDNGSSLILLATDPYVVVPAKGAP